MLVTATSGFGALLRRHRLAAGLTQEALAERAGLSARGVQDLERGVRQAPRAETVRLLADALELADSARAGLIAAANPELATPTAIGSARVRPSALPVPPTPLVGREAEVAAARRLLGEGQVRLLTLTGPGGIGKTRIALAVASALEDEFADGAAWVDLAPLVDHNLFAAAVAQALGIREAGSQALPDLVTAAVAAARLLLVLDSCEHLLPATPFIAALLAAGPGLAVLATSRSRLRLRGEREVPVAPLPVPPVTENEPLATPDIGESAAVRLFVERAQAVAPGFALSVENATDVAAICRQVDGIPLALELAAAHVKVLPPVALLPRLSQRLPLLSGGSRDAPGRQRTMRDTIAWSYDLLTPGEQSLYRRLAVFAGSCTLDAAAAIAAANDDGERGQADVLETLAGLVDQSMLRLEEPSQINAAGEARFVMLETVREYALERLAASGDERIARRAHAMFFLALLEAMRDRLHGVEGPALLNRLDAEHANVQAALAWTVAEGEAELALRMTNAFWRFWWMHSHLGQGRLWIERVLALPDPHGAAIAHRPRALVAAGYFARIQGDHEQAIAFGEEAMAAAREQGDSNAMAAARFLLGLVAFDRGDLEAARTHHQFALILEREINDAHGLALQLTCLGEIAIADGNLGGARALGEEALAIWKGRGDAWGTAWALIQLGKVARAEGGATRAIALLRDSLAANEQLGDKEITARAIFELAAIACARGEFSLATRLYGSVAALREAIGAPLAPVDHRRYEQAVAVARSALTEEAFAAAWHEGFSRQPKNVLCDVLDSST